MKKILVPTDFSKNAIIATAVAADVARRSGAELVLLHVIEEVTGGSFNVEGEVASSDVEDKLFNLQLIRKARKQPEKAVLDPSFRDVKVDGELKVGNPFHGIRTLLTQGKFDLVVRHGTLVIPGVGAVLADVAVTGDKIAAVGCTEMQGYLFSRPLPVAEIERLFLSRLPKRQDPQSAAVA